MLQYLLEIISQHTQSHKFSLIYEYSFSSQWKQIFFLDQRNGHYLPETEGINSELLSYKVLIIFYTYFFTGNF